MASLQSDASGFLTGSPLGSDQAVRLLSGIKGDTKRILEAMCGMDLRRTNTTRRAPLLASPGASYARAVTAGGRAMSTARELARDPATGRFVSSPRSTPPTPTEQRMARSAEVAAQAAQVVAKATEVQNREAKLAENKQPRKKNGQFGNGEGSGDGKGSHGDGAGSGLLHAAAVAIDGTERIDPLIESANEIKGLAQLAKNVVSPVLRFGRGLFGKKKTAEQEEQHEQTGLLKKIHKALKGQSSGESNGGLLGMLSSLVGFLPAMLPAIGSLIPLLVRFIPYVGVILAAAALLPGASKKLAVWADNQLAKLPDGDSFLANPGKAARARLNAKLPLGDAGGVLSKLETAALGAGASVDDVRAIAMRESSFNPAAASKTSTASGLGGFTDGTWKDSIKRWGAKYGYTEDKAGELRADPDAQVRMLAERAAFMANEARKAGFADPAAIGAQHVLGAGSGGGGLRLMSANRKDPMADISTAISAEALKANPQLFAGARTVGDAAAIFSRYMNPTATLNTPSALKGMSLSAAPTLPTQSIVQLPTVPAVSSPAAIARIGEPPALDFMSGPGRVSSPPPVNVTLPANLGQDVRDRDIAHIATGGIGNGQSRR